MTARVGIAIPVFNTDDAFLREAIDSATGQTVQVDVVVVDDGSTEPGTRLALAEYAAQGRVRVVRQDPNRGVAAALNTGFGHLTTPYVFAMGSDDIVDPTYAEKAAKILDARDEVAVVAPQIQHFGASDSLEAPGGAPHGVIDLLFYNPLPGIAVCRRDAWEQVGGFTELRWAEDYDFWLRLLHLGGVCATLDEPLYRYRIHAAQATETTTWEVKLAQQLEIVRRNPQIWGAHIDVIMERLWQQQMELNYYKKRYGRFNELKKGAVDRALAASARAKQLAGRSRSRS